MASLDSSMPPSTDCSASMSCGGVRSNFGPEVLGAPASPIARSPGPEVTPLPIVWGLWVSGSAMGQGIRAGTDTFVIRCRNGAPPRARADVRGPGPAEQRSLCTQLWMMVWATPPADVHELGTAL